ncbi:hypothetical protein [Streptomyces sp. NBC_01508]
MADELELELEAEDYEESGLMRPNGPSCAGSASGCRVGGAGATQ